MRIQIGTGALVLLSAGFACAAKDACFDCHSVMEGMSIPFKNDVHYKNGISCADCHGGDPNSDDQNVSMSAERGFRVRVTRNGTPGFCGHCHSNAANMRKHNPSQRVDQLALYRTSVHGTTPEGSDSVAATCVDCHGVHNIRAVNDAQSSVSPANLAATCGKCHGDEATLFRKSPHGAVFTTRETAACATCHESHATKRASGEMLAGGRAVCARCHEPDTKGGQTAAALERQFERLMLIGRGAPGAGGPGFGGSGSESFRRARVAVHSLDVAAVKAAAESAPSASQK